MVHNPIYTGPLYESIQQELNTLAPGQSQTEAHFELSGNIPGIKNETRYVNNRRQVVLFDVCVCVRNSTPYHFVVVR